MRDKEFNKVLRILNVRYKEIFDYIPQITDYSCSRDEYIEAMNNAIASKIDISNYVIRYE